jgi:hypothetical protein
MRINLTGVSSENPNEWIKPTRKPDGGFEVKKYILKVVAIDDSEYSSTGDQILKVDFRTVDNKIYQEKFSLGENLLWKLKRFIIAMNAPDDLNVNDLIGRYVIATIGGRDHNGKEYNNLLEWGYSELNDKLPPFPSYKDADITDEELAEELF